MDQHESIDPILEAAAFIREQRSTLAEVVVARIYGNHSSDWESYGKSGHEKSVRDMGYHLTYLAEALEASDLTLFTEYVAWVKVLFAGLDLPGDAWSTTLQNMQAVLQDALPRDPWEAVQAYLDAGLVQCEKAPTTLPSFLQSDAPLTDLAQAYLETLLQGQRHVASRLIMDAVDEEASVKAIYLHVFQPVQREIGRLWQQNQISVAEEHYCTAATQLIMSQLYPKIFNTAKSGRRLVATCVGGELHEIGVRMVADFFEMEGWDTYYLGANTPAESVLQTVETQEADVLAISATITSHVSKVIALITRARTAYPQDMPKILVGGYPFNTSPDLWRQVGADGYAPNAQQAIALADRLVGNG